MIMLKDLRTEDLFVCYTVSIKTYFYIKISTLSKRIGVMTEKRYKGNKYVYCYCNKHDQVLVGTEIYKYMNVFADIVGPSVTLLIIFSEVNISYKLFFILIFVVPVITLTLLNYRDAKKEMLSAGHSDDCSAKIARMVTYRASLWGDKLKIMKSKDDGIRIGYGFERLKW